MQSDRPEAMPFQFISSKPADVESETTAGSLKRRSLTELEEFDEDGHIKRTGNSRVLRKSKIKRQHLT